MPLNMQLLPNKPIRRMSLFLADNTEYWRKRGEQMRAMAEDMRDPLARAMVLRIAKDYEKLAENAEVRTRGGKTDL